MYKILLRARQGEKHDDRRDPDDEQPRDAIVQAVANRPPERDRNHQRPGKEVGEHHRDVKQQAARLLAHRFGVAAEVLAEDERADVFPSVLAVQQVVPRHDDREADDRPGGQHHVPQIAEPLLRREIYEEHHRGKEHRHRPLGQHAESRRDVHQARYNRRRCGRVSASAKHSSTSPIHIVMWMSMMMRRASSSSRGDVASTSAASSPAVVPPSSRPRPNAVATITSAPRAIGSALAPLGDAEQSVRRRDVPVRQDGLVHPQLEIEARRHVVAGLHHLARRLRVERLVRIPDRRDAEVDEIRDDSSERAARQAACRSRASQHRAVQGITA